ncbi:MAG: CrcB family protein [Deltaproteobacteria bacterium]|nr:CrcB family protein [Deltaproteobacteria bacterium]MCW5807936.1 CrcB family protein [Deltaproteobacteria bacterium]
MDRIAIVFVAGGLGSVARYGAGVLLGPVWATFAVNVVGSFLIAVVLELAVRIADFPVNLRLALATGLLGGFTTYSTFNAESTGLWLEGAQLRAALNVIGTVVACMAAGLLGLWLARRLA